MSEINDEKPVDFSYCQTCVYWPLAEFEYPCHDCLNTPTNTNSYKPVNYRKKKSKE